MRYSPEIYCWAISNPCTDCRDKSKCVGCTKSVEYVREVYIQAAKNVIRRRNARKNHSRV